MKITKSTEDGAIIFLGNRFVQSAKTDLWKFEQLTTYSYVRYNENIRTIASYGPTRFLSHRKYHHGRFTGADTCGRKTQFIGGNVCSPLQVRSYVFFSFIRACKRNRPTRFAKKTILDQHCSRARWKRIGAIWKRSIFVRVASSKNAATSLTGARRLNWIDIMKTTYVYIILLSGIEIAYGMCHRNVL